MPEKLTNCMLERFQVNGAQPLLESRVREMITTSINTSHEALQAAVLERINELRGGVNNRNEQRAEDEQPSVWPSGEIVEGYRQWTWQGRIHMVPEGWRLPTGTTSMLFNLWVKGDESMRVQPYSPLPPPPPPACVHTRACITDHSHGCLPICPLTCLR